MSKLDKVTHSMLKAQAIGAAIAMPFLIAMIVHFALHWL